MEKSHDDMVRKRSHLSAEEKYQIFLEAAMAKGNGSISEIMRRWAIHSSDLTRIRKSVEEAAISNFKAKKSRKPKIDYEQHQEDSAMKKKPTYEELEQRVKELEGKMHERKCVEEALQESEEKYQLLAESLLDAVYEFDLEGKFTYVNKASTNMFGYSKDETLSGLRVEDMIVEEDKPLSRKAIKDILTGKTTVGERTFLRKDGTRFIGEIHSGPIYKGKDVVGVRGVLRDITERKRSEEEVSKLSSAVVQSIDGIAIGDLEPKLIYVNSGFARMHGYEPHEMVGIKVKSLHNAEQMEAFTKGMHEIKTQGSWMGEIDHIRKDSTPFPTYMSVTLLKDDKGKPTGILAVCRDITERKRAEDALRASEAQKQALLDASVDRIRLVDLDMKIIWANKRTGSDLNRASEELKGQYCFEVLVGRHVPCPRCPTKKALKSGHMEHAVIHRDPSKGANREAYWDNYAVPIKSESGDIVSLVQITRNITKQKLAERALREREKELKIKTNTLSELNAALRVLIERKDNDRLETEQKVLFNVKELVIPFLERLKKTSLTSKQLSYLYILDSNFNDIISPFSRTLSSKYLRLTPTEIQVANLVKDGRTSQEIAEVMNLSRRTVESHRDGIRKKLDLRNRKANLRSYLLSI